MWSEKRNCIIVCHNCLVDLVLLFVLFSLFLRKFTVLCLNKPFLLYTITEAVIQHWKLDMFCIFLLRRNYKTCQNKSQLNIFLWESLCFGWVGGSNEF